MRNVYSRQIEIADEDMTMANLRALLEAFTHWFDDGEVRTSVELRCKNGDGCDYDSFVEFMRARPALAGVRARADRLTVRMSESGSGIHLRLWRIMGPHTLFISASDSDGSKRKVVDGLYGAIKEIVGMFSKGTAKMQQVSRQGRHPRNGVS